MNKYLTILITGLFLPLFAAAGPNPVSNVMLYSVLFSFALGVIFAVLLLIKVIKILYRKYNKGVYDNPLTLHILEKLSLIALPLMIFYYFFSYTCDPEWLGDLAGFVVLPILLFFIFGVGSVVKYTYLSFKDIKNLKLLLISIVFSFALFGFQMYGIHNSEIHHTGCIQVPGVQMY